jgi:hypothetical protein
MAPGPLLLERPPQSQPYRGAGQDDAPRTHAGTRHDLVAELQGTRSSIDVLVVGWLIPLTTPLLVALVFAYWG